MAFGAFYLQDTAGSPERARWLHLARSGSQSQHAIWFILPARRASHIIRPVIDLQPMHITSETRICKLVPAMATTAELKISSNLHNCHLLK